MWRCLLVVLAASLCGCATLSKDETQPLDIRVFDLDGHPVAARCTLVNGSLNLVGNAPLFRVPVDRSGSDLSVECNAPGLPAARATAVSRSSVTVGVVVQPLAGTVIDHITGRLYDYPTRMDLVLGRELVFDRRSTSDFPVSSAAIPLTHVAGGPTARAE